ncbi:MAG: hypothetical protein C4516_04725 [Oxalobacter sp.]|nr:MAG: hypothetical protein C4516_04725 [Oxalobacter sp.]
MLPDINLKPRVFVKKAGGDYVEVTGVQSFERSDFENQANNVSFEMDGRQEQTVVDLLDANDKSVDVKMEFSLGMTMVMTFSGEVIQFTGDSLTVSMQTPVETEVSDSSLKLH